MSSPRTRGKGWWLGVLLLALAIVCAFGSTSSTEASANAPLGTRYTGATSTGGTITLVLTDDQSEVLWFSVEDLFYPTTDPMAPCGSGTHTGTWYQTPPSQLVSPNFSFHIPLFHAQANFQATIESSSAISGTSTFSTVPIGCPLATITWSALADGPTAAGKLDRLYSGSAGSGTIDMTIAPGGKIRTIAIGELELPDDCPYAYWVRLPCAAH